MPSLMSDYDRANVASILADPVANNWTNAYVIRFMDVLIKKGAKEDVRALYKIYPRQIVAVMVYYGWSLSEIENYLDVST
jgi:hypothetical protein